MQIFSKVSNLSFGPDNLTEKIIFMRKMFEKMRFLDDKLTGFVKNELKQNFLAEEEEDPEETYALTLRPNLQAGAEQPNGEAEGVEKEDEDLMAGNGENLEEEQGELEAEEEGRFIRIAE